MHPWIAHIHPGLRAALTAWVLARAAVLLTLVASGKALAPRLHELSGGAPGWALLTGALGMLGELGPWVLLGLAECGLLVGTMAVYHFCRKDALPQTADRAAWFLALSPLMALLVPLNAWTLAVPAGLVCLAAAAYARHVWATVALLVAMSLCPETLLLLPGAALIGWRSRQSGKTPEWAPWLLALAPVAFLTLMVFAAFGFAGMGGLSMRTLPRLAWREGLVWRGLWDAVLVLGLLAQGVSVVRFAGHTPKVWPLVTLPCLAWPLLQQEAASSAPLILCAAPLWAYLAKIGEDPGAERPMLAVSVIALMVACML